jgi:hypothetical protein
MTDAIFHSPAAINETVQSYAPGTKEREQVLAEYDRMMKQKRELPMWIGGKAVETKDRRAARPPHQHKHILGYSHHGDKGHVKQAINAALKARKEWESMRWEDRAAIFLKAADLIAGPYRATINAASMLAQSKNAFQAEIDAARIERFEGAELLGDDQRRVVGQHDAAGAHPDGAGAAGDMPDDHRGGGAGHADHVVVLGHPVAPVAPGFGVTGEVEGVAQRVGGGVAPAHRDEVEDGERDHGSFRS